MLNLKAVKFRENSPIKTALEQIELVIECLAVIISADILSQERKSAAALILKHLIPDWRELVEEYAVVTDRNDALVRRWKMNVLKRDNYTCIKCGNKGEYAHHIIHWSLSPLHRIDVNNGITLCTECHAEEHKGEKAEKLILSRKR